MDIQESLERPRSFWFAERIIFFGTILSFFIFSLLLAWTERHNTALPGHHFLNYLFDTVSVGTLTGLFRGDSGNLTFNGQFVLLLDMIINGLMTSVVSIILIIFVRLGFDKKKTLRGEVKKIGTYTKAIVTFIFLDFLFIWVLGTILLQVTGSNSLWEALFNSASHILNDGVTARVDNMVPYAHNISMLLSGAFLIAIGGLGISIRGYFYKPLLRWLGLARVARKIPDEILAPKNFVIAVLVVTLTLQLFGAFCIYAFERHNGQLFSVSTSGLTRFVDSYYMSVSARTAGFSVFPNLALLHDKSNLVMMLLMAVGAAPGSFAGGVLKLTAFIYLLVLIQSRMRGDRFVRTRHGFIQFARRSAIEAEFRIIGFTIIVLGLTLLLFFIEPNISGFHLAFESISAVSNTGLTLGATQVLNAGGMIVIIILMTVGKIGFIATVSSFVPRYRRMIERAETDADSIPVD